MVNLIAHHLDIWTTAQTPKSNSGRGGGGNHANGHSPHGIKKLRELILELAVRGKLVPQEPKDEPASVLVEKIAKEKARLIRDGKIKIPKGFPEISEDEKPFDLPEEWKWLRIGGVGHDWGQKIPNNDFTYIDVSAINNEAGTVESPNILTASGAPSRARKIVKVGTVIYSTVRPYLKNISLIDREYSPEPIASTAFAILHPFQEMPGKFIAYYLRSPAFVNYVESVQTGIAYPAINDKQFFNGIIPIPPIAEQHRIVAKVDELMALCDRLEQQQADSNETHQILVEALLATLTKAADQKEFAAAWHRIADHFDTLFTTEQSIDQLKQTILQLAVMGKLVPQDPKDEPASVLLEKIAKEKAQLIEKGKIKNQKPLPEIGEDEKPFELPNVWEWARMAEICTLITDGTHQTPTYTKNGRLFISAQNIKPFKFMPENHRWVSEEDYHEYIKNRKPEQGDILLTRVGAGIGEAAVINTAIDFAIYVSVGLLKLSKRKINPEYLVIWLNSPNGRKHSERNTYGKGVSQGNLNLSLIRNFVVSIPPITEQHRIVAKVYELMTLCDDLKTRLKNAHTTQIKLADAIVEQAIAEAFLVQTMA